MTDLDAVDFSERRSEEVMFLLTLSVQIKRYELCMTCISSKSAAHIMRAWSTKSLMPA